LKSLCKNGSVLTINNLGILVCASQADARRMNAPRTVIKIVKCKCCKKKVPGVHVNGVEGSG
jgi:hypothetical protein